MNNLTEAITNDDLVARFQKYGQIKKVNKKNHYAFITYNDRGAAEAAEAAENQQILKDAQMDVQIHVPLSGVAKRMVQTIKGMKYCPSGYEIKKQNFEFDGIKIPQQFKNKWLTVEAMCKMPEKGPRVHRLRKANFSKGGWKIQSRLCVCYIFTIVKQLITFLVSKYIFDSYFA